MDQSDSYKMNYRHNQITHSINDHLTHRLYNSICLYVEINVIEFAGWFKKNGLLMSEEQCTIIMNNFDKLGRLDYKELTTFINHFQAVSSRLMIYLLSENFVQFLKKNVSNCKCF